MMKVRYIIVAVGLLMNAASNDVLHSQPVEDYRLSPDALDYRLPEEIRIQAAGRIGDSRLVVWGTTVDDGRGNVVNALVINVNGTQKRLTSPEGRPYGAVGVVPLADRFLVVWNDRRSGEEGIRARTVLKDGEFGGSEFVFSPDGVIRGEVYWWSGADHAHVLWTDIRSGVVETRSMKVGVYGEPLESESVLGTGGIVADETTRLADGSLIIGRGDRAGILIDSDGQFAAMPIPTGRLSQPYWIDQSGAIVVLEEGNLRRYAIAMSTTPEWSVAVPARALQSEPRLIGKDTLGWFLLSHQATYDTWGYSIEGVKYYVDPDERVNGRIDTLQLGYLSINPSGSRSCTLENLSAVRWRYNQFYVTLKATAWFDPIGSFQQSTERIITYSLDRTGNIRTPAGEFDVLPLSTDQIVKRRSFDTLSRVAVIYYREHDTLPYAEPITPVFYTHPDLRPNIWDVDNRLNVTWVQDHLALQFRTYDSFSEGCVDSNSIAGEFGPHMPQQWGGGVYTYITASASGHKEFPSGVDVWSTTSTGWALLPSRDGWRTVTVDVRNIVAGGRTEMAFKGVALNRATNAFTFVTFLPHSALTGSPAQHFCSTIHPDRISDTLRWKIEGNFDDSFGYVPIHDSAGFLVLGHDELGEVAKDLTTRRITLPSIPSAERIGFKRLYGDRFLRYGYTLSQSILTLELYDMNAALFERREFQMIGMRDPFVLQNPVDSAIVLLWGSDRGVRCVYLDKSLRERKVVHTDVVLTDFRVSSADDSTAYPAGIFRNDTLFVVWEDFRNGPEADIYGTWWAVPKGLRAIGEGAITDTVATPPQIPAPGDTLLSGIRIISITPNPVIGQGGVTIESTERKGGRIALYDALGRRVLNEEVILSEGVNTYRLNVSGLSGGSYGVRVSSGEGVASSRVIVYPQ